jgi:hypothetical protein
LDTSSESESVITGTINQTITSNAPKGSKRKERKRSSEEGRERGKQESSGRSCEGTYVDDLVGCRPSELLSSKFDQETKEAEAWKDGSKGGKSSKEEKEEKRKADLARKAENARLLAEEEASVPAKVKPAPKAAKKATKPAGPGAIAAGAVHESLSSEAVVGEEPDSYAATGIDNAIDLLDVVNAKMDKASIGQQAAGIERHPEV